jgi:hypothetical protein
MKLKKYKEFFIETKKSTEDNQITNDKNEFKMKNKNKFIDQEKDFDMENISKPAGKSPLISNQNINKPLFNQTKST